MTCLRTLILSPMLALVLLLDVVHAQQDECDQTTCPPQEVEGVSIAEFSSKDVGTCLQRPTEEGGHADLVQEAMVKTYNNIFASTPSTASTVDQQILRGFQAARYGATLENSEGIYYCAVNNTFTPNESSESFFWVVNANVLAAGASGNEGLVANLTNAELAMGASLGFVVDDALTGETGGGVFVRYVFSDSAVMRTEHQPIPGASNFQCSERPWYQMATTCKDPAKLLCPSIFEGSEGVGTFQVYGNPEARIAVAQDVPKWQMCECLDDLECTDSGTENPTSTGWSLLSVGPGMRNAELVAIAISTTLLGLSL